MPDSPVHKFHIPVMGLAFTIDTPIKVARFGISSVISIMEDRLIETMRSYYYPITNKVYFPISTKEPDYRAKRITDYLNLVNEIVQAQVEKLKQEEFTPGSEIARYFELLPEDNSSRQLYNIMLSTDSAFEKNDLATFLRSQVKAGSIDVNIMTKLDRNTFDAMGNLVENGSEAIAALRGYVNSNLEGSSVVFSAGLNPRLYNYLEKCHQFDADAHGSFKKRIIIKVSDYRSALIQGKYLAKKGVWVSEFRIESGLNCGGHAFATDGYLMGPILEEFKTKKQELTETIFNIYKTAGAQKGITITRVPPLRISAQGGIGTAREDRFLHEHYAVDSTGWGTPFLLVPEATTVDVPTLTLLCKATPEDIFLSNHSPLGVRYHYLKGTSGEAEKQARINAGKPGSPCTEKHLVSNTEFTKEPICTASRQYQQLKIASLKSQNLPEPDYQKQLASVLEKECLCIGLSNAAATHYKVPFLKKLEAVTICPGPNISWFKKIASLNEMVGHIYGRSNLLEDNNRPHMFVNELNLYIDYLQEKLGKEFPGTNEKELKYFKDFYGNLVAGIAYYEDICHLLKSGAQHFTADLKQSTVKLRALGEQYALSYHRKVSEQLV